MPVREKRLPDLIFPSIEPKDHVLFNTDEYEFELLACSDPTCICDDMRFHFDHKATGNRAVKVTVDAETKTVNRTASFDNTMTKEIIDLIEQKFQERDWNDLRVYFMIQKNLLSEDPILVQAQDIDFPQALRRDPTLIQVYLNYLPNAEIFNAKNTKGSNRYLMDLYCVNPDCPCEHVYLEVIDQFDEVNRIEEGAIYYDYKNGTVNHQNTTMDYAEAKAYIQECLAKYPRFNQRLELRHENLRSLSRKWFSQFVRRSSLRRNSPCTCGSGKKYKQCCGRRSRFRRGDGKKLL